MRFQYYYGSEAEQFTFVKLPKTILFDNTFEELSLVAKVLYGLLLDRMSLSRRNNWIDDENRVFIIYQIAEIQEDLKLSKKKAIECLAELEKFGLVEKKRRGQGLPNILYVKNFKEEENAVEYSEQIDTSRSSDSDTSRSVCHNTSKGVDVTPLEVSKLTPVKSKIEVNNTYKSNNNINNIYHNDTLIESYPKYVSV